MRKEENPMKQYCKKIVALFLSILMFTMVGCAPTSSVSDDDYTYDPNQNGFAPIVYNPSSKMYYQPTLVFPLKKAGEFKSRITDFKVYNYLKQ